LRYPPAGEVEERHGVSEVVRQIVAEREKARVIEEALAGGHRMQTTCRLEGWPGSVAAVGAARRSPARLWGARRGRLAALRGSKAVARQEKCRQPRRYFVSTGLGILGFADSNRHRGGHVLTTSRSSPMKGRSTLERSGS